MDPKIDLFCEMIFQKRVKDLSKGCEHFSLKNVSRSKLVEGLHEHSQVDNADVKSNITDILLT